MAKIDPLDDVGSLANTTSARAVINNNSQKIEEAFANTVSRDGSAPNQMEADFDLNDHYLLNVADPVNEADGVNLRSVRPLVNQFASDIIDAAGLGRFYDYVSVPVTEGQTVVSYPTTLTQGLIAQVFYNGILQYPSTYTTGGGSITFSEPLPADGAVLIAVSGEPGTSMNAGVLSYTAPGSTITRLISDKLDDVISVTDYDTVQEAVARAFTTGATLYWPDGEHAVTGNIPNLHNVRHTGSGYITRGAATFYPNPKTGQTNTLNVATTGDDANDGIGTDFPMLLPATAATRLANYGPTLNGSWIISLAAGTYPGGVLLPRYLSSRDFIKIIGPSVGGHPNVPTAIIDKSADASKTFGILANDGMLLWVEDIKVTGAFGQAVYCTRDCYLQYRNTHIDGADQGLTVFNGSRYEVRGGIIENCNLGVSELFHVTRNYETVVSAADQVIIRNNNIGLKAKENCVGHLDFANFEDNATGVEMQLYSGANVNGAVFKRNGIAIVLTNSEIHDETAAVYGSGADANTRRRLALGNASSELAFTGWAANNGNPAQRTGHRPLILAGTNYTQTDHTGTTAETTIQSFAGILPADMFAVRGKKMRVVVYGRANNLLAGTARILLRVGGTFAVDVTIPAALAANGAFRAEFEMVCTADGANQLFHSNLLADNVALDVQAIPRTIDVSTSNTTVAVSCILANSADTIRFYAIELHG